MTCSLLREALCSEGYLLQLYQLQWGSVMFRLVLHLEIISHAKLHCTDHTTLKIMTIPHQWEAFVPSLASSVLQEDPHTFCCLAISLTALPCPSLVVLLMLYPTSDHHNMFLVSSVCPQPIYPQLTLPSEFCIQHTMTLKENIILKILCCLLW